jgi:hypothetical protein
MAIAPTNSAVRASQGLCHARSRARRREDRYGRAYKMLRSGKTLLTREAGFHWHAECSDAPAEVDMRWSSGDRGNIEDMRGRSGGGGMIPLGIGGIIVVGLLSMFTGIDFFSLLGGGGGGSNSPTASVGTSGSVKASPSEEKMVDMVDAVARDVQQTWQQKLGNRYEPTKVSIST